MDTIFYCFIEFYNLILIIKKFKSRKFTALKMLFNSTFFLEINKLN